jgi:hypothetical protein
MAPGPSPNDITAVALPWIVAIAERSVGVDEELRADEQRDAFHARWRVGQAREHEVDDVLGHVVLAPGDEDLRAADAVVISLGDGLGTDGREVGAGLRLGDVHRAGPAALDHRRQVALLQLIAGVVRDRLDRAEREHLAQREGHVRGLPHLQHRGGQQRGHALPAELGAGRHRVPAGCAEGGVGLLEALGGGDHAVAPAAALGVALGIDRREHFGGEFRRLVEDRLDQIAGYFFMGGLRQHGVQAAVFLHREKHVAQWRCIGGHWSPSFDGYVDRSPRGMRAGLGAARRSVRARQADTGWLMVHPAQSMAEADCNC